MMASLLGPLNFYKLACAGVVVTYTLCSLTETTTSEFRPEVKSQDFEYFLTWEPGNASPSVCYSVVYAATNSIPCLTETESNSSQRHEDTSYSKSRSWQRENPLHQVSEPGEPSVCPPVPEGSVWSKTSKYRLNSSLKAIIECSNISTLFCNLTKEFTDPCTTYSILVEQVTEREVHTSLRIFNPYLATCLGPPQFNISACPNCINVTVKLSSPSLIKVYKELDYTVTAAAEGLPNKYVYNKTREASFHTVIGNLHPNSNYCITVNMSTTVNNKQCRPSSPKCIIVKTKDKSGVILPTFLAGLFMALIFLFGLLGLYKTGFICFRKTKWPEVLKVTAILPYSFFESDPEEILIIHVTQENKKKVWNYDEEEDSGSDIENDGIYTIRCSAKISKSSSIVDLMEELSTSCSSATSDTAELAAELENLQNETDKDEVATNNFFCPSEKSLPEEPESDQSDCLNVNLHSVKLGISDKNWDIIAALSDQDESAGLKELHISHASESAHFMNISNGQSPSSYKPSLKQNSWGSGESESSDSEADNIGDYMRRGNL